MYTINMAVSHIRMHAIYRYGIVTCKIAMTGVTCMFTIDMTSVMYVCYRYDTCHMYVYYRSAVLGKEPRLRRLHCGWGATGWGVG